MGEITGITWTDHTFNPWIGCTKVSPGCDHCYAETLVVNRMGGEWGPGAPRRRTSPGNWQQPVRWDRAAAKAGVRRRTFSASLADVFDAEVPDEWRVDLWALIRATPNLDWQLLTKRAARIRECLPPDWGEGYPNVWLGVSAENQKWADARIPRLLDVPAVVHFVSAEPLLGPLDLSGNADGVLWPWHEALAQGHAANWVIVGGESGPGARPMQLEWARHLRDQCQRVGVPFFFKQWGDASPDRMPGVHHGGDVLDGKQYHEFPESAPVTDQLAEDRLVYQRDRDAEVRRAARD